MGPGKRGVLRCGNTTWSFRENSRGHRWTIPDYFDGNRCILVAMHYFRKWVEVYALLNQEAATVIEVLVKKLVSRFEVPTSLRPRHELRE